MCDISINISKLKLIDIMPIISSFVTYVKKIQTHMSINTNQYEKNTIEYRPNN